MPIALQGSWGCNLVVEHLLIMLEALGLLVQSPVLKEKETSRGMGEQLS